MKSLQRQQRKLAAKGIAVDIATLRREWEAKREMTSTSAGTSGGVASVSADDSVTTGSPGSQHRQANNDDDDDDTDIDVEDDSTMDKNICHESENLCHDDVNVTSDEETNYNNINCTSTTMKPNNQQNLATEPGCDVITSYSDDSKRMSEGLKTSEERISPPRTTRPSAAKRSNPFSIESLLSQAEEYTD
jgi:hypothetical protein